jgi:magnesium-transporting ATPase (P-type)
MKTTTTTASAASSSRSSSDPDVVVPMGHASEDTAVLTTVDLAATGEGPSATDATATSWFPFFKKKQKSSSEKEQEALEEKRRRECVRRPVNEAFLDMFSPANEREQWEIVQSFKLVDAGNKARSVEDIIDRGLQQGQDKALDEYLQIYGPNELPKPELESYFLLWIHAFYDIMMILLVIAMIVLYAVGDVVAASAILLILMIATNIGAYTEYSSNKAAAELGDLPGSTLVKTSDGWKEFVNTKLLPGMIIQLKSGDIVPADTIILRATVDCSCNEAMLTGESEPVHKYKFHHDVDDDDPDCTDKREAMTRLYMGTEFSGDCIGLVVETGQRTQMGRIYQAMVDDDPERSPLQIMIDRLIYVLAMLSIAASVINAAICIPTSRGVEPNSEDPDWLTCTLNSIALTVAAVPENLPVALGTLFCYPFVSYSFL